MKSKRWIPSAQPLAPPKSLLPNHPAATNFPDVLAECVGDLARRMAWEHEIGRAKQFVVVLEELTSLRAQLGTDAKEEAVKYAESILWQHVDTWHEPAVDAMPCNGYTNKDLQLTRKLLLEYAEAANAANCSNGSTFSFHSSNSQRQSTKSSVRGSDLPQRSAKSGVLKAISKKSCSFLNESDDEESDGAKIEGQVDRRATFSGIDLEVSDDEEDCASDIETEGKTFTVLDAWQKLRNHRRTRSRIDSGTTRFTGDMLHSDTMEIEVESQDGEYRVDSFFQSRMATLLRYYGWRNIVMDPCCNRRLVWDTLAVILFFADTIYVPLQILNTDEHSFNGPTSWIIRLYWSINIPMSMFTGYLRKDGSTQTDLKATARRYSRTWFVPDLILIVFDWMEVFLAAELKKHLMLRVIRLVRLVRITRISSNLYSTLTFRYNSERALINLDIVGTVICLVALTHVIACLWYSLGNWDSPRRVSWIDDSGLRGAPAEYQYVASFHWALSQFAGGMDEFRPYNIEERIFTIVILLIGFMVLSVCVSGLTSSMTRLIMISSVQSRQLAKLRQYLSESCISRKLAIRIQNNAEQIMIQQTRRLREQDVELLESVSESMRVELRFETRAPHLMAHSFFERYNEICPSGMRTVCHKAIFLKTCSPGDLVFSSGETPAIPQMLFVTGGHLRYAKPNYFHTDQVVPTLSHLQTHTVKSVLKGSWVSEANLWTEWEHCGSLSAVTFCDILAINATTFQEIVCRFQGDFLDECVDYAVNFVRFLNTLNVEVLTDLEILLPPSRQSQREVWRQSRVSCRQSVRAPAEKTGRMSLLLKKFSTFSNRNSVRSSTQSLLTRSQTMSSLSANGNKAGGSRDSATFVMARAGTNLGDFEPVEEGNEKDAEIHKTVSFSEN